MKILQKDFLAQYFIIAVLSLGSSPAFAQVSISIDIAPPPLQVYEQPACPDDGYIWTPGYWAYGDNAYYWVPGAWVQPPEIGVYWTPPYWGWNENAYVFYPGYWGPTVGYYGGINYGYGYGGHGYGGGRWQGGHFSYNTAVNNVSSSTIHNTYVDRTAVKKSTRTVSYNGGKGGVQAQPTAQERTTHPTSVQQAPVGAASQNKPSAASAPFTGESVKSPAKPQPKEVNPQPATTFHPQAQAQQEAPKQQQQAQAQQQPAHQQQPPQPKPKQEAQPQQQGQQQTHEKGPAAQPDKKSDNDPNNAPNH